jgi:hypothetical protein
VRVARGVAHALLDEPRAPFAARKRGGAAFLLVALPLCPRALLRLAKFTLTALGQRTEMLAAALLLCFALALPRGLPLLRRRGADGGDRAVCCGEVVRFTLR